MCNTLEKGIFRRFQVNVFLENCHVHVQVASKLSLIIAICPARVVIVEPKLLKVLIELLTIQHINKENAEYHSRIYTRESFH